MSTKVTRLLAKFEHTGESKYDVHLYERRDAADKAKPKDYVVQKSHRPNPNQWQKDIVTKEYDTLEDAENAFCKDVKISFWNITNDKKRDT